MQTLTLPTLETYARHLRATAGWLVESIRHGNGGSCAHFSVASGWSRPYPETTGYLIPTLLELDPQLPELGLRERALGLGDWLLSIRNADGAWDAGLHPPRGRARSSVFNSCQVLDGLVALHRATGESRWLDAAHRGATWATGLQGADGLWSHRDYDSSGTPSYYTQALWPLLEVWKETGDETLRTKAEAALLKILQRRREQGSFAAWGFGGRDRAFTHTIAYTLRGILECSRLLDAWDDVGVQAVPALERLLRKAELSGGRLPGELDGDWNATRRFVCLTGNVQTATNLLLWEQREKDLRIVNAAAKLIDVVCAAQSLRKPLVGHRGAVAGSQPAWGRYMALRHPNWAAKFHCDALMQITAPHRGRARRGMRLLLTAGHDRALHAIALAELCARDGHELASILVVSPWSWKRLRSLARQRGRGFVLSAARRLAGRTAGMPTEQAMEAQLAELGVTHRSLRSWARERGVPLHGVSRLDDARAVRLARDASADMALYGGGGILRQTFLDAVGGPVLNAHSGPLPQVRGMNACEWSLLLAILPR